MSALLPFSEVTRLDSELVRLGRGSAGVRLAVGEALDALSSSGGHHELGFSSLEAYARERCERSGRWAADTRALAKRLWGLPRTREALQLGVIGWSTAELLARHVAGDSEVEWLERARKCTVRELRSLLADAGAKVDDDAADEPEATRTLTVRATREDGWMFECARKVAEAIAGPMSPDRLIQALLAEGYSSLLELVPEGVLSELHDIERLEHEATVESEAHVSWRAELRRFRTEAEELCEARLSLSFEAEPPAVTETTVSSCSLPRGPEALDREIRRLCSELSAHDLALGIVAESARKAEVWRRLGFATEAQYARERVGVSLSSLKAKRILAARASRVPELGAALASGRVGYEAAYLLSRIVTPATVEPWIRRAERRTVKHLREEVEAAELLIRMGRGRDQAPLDEASLEELFELERSIVSGDVLDGVQSASGGGVPGSERSSGFNGETASRAAGQMSGGGRTGAETAGRSAGLGPGSDASAASAQHGNRTARLGKRFARVTLRWLVKEQTYRFWRALESVFARVSSRVCRARTSFLGFLCENFCRIWLPALRHERLTETGEQPEYFRVYRRDAFRCTSPVCSRRDVTPHHLQFRSRGGGDEDENVASLCVWCHLHGVHEGRIAAEPPASRIRWRIGRSGTLRIDGRTRVAA